MNLSAVALRSMVAYAVVEVGLALAGTEITVGGYVRQPATRWAETGDAAMVDVTFGPFVARATYDEAVLVVDGQIVDHLPLADGGTDSIAPGALLDFRATIKAG